MYRYSLSFLRLMMLISYSSAFLFSTKIDQGFRLKLSGKHQCDYCTEIFESRNSLFRHLRNSECARGQDSSELPQKPYELRRIDAALLLNYDSVSRLNDESTNVDCRQKVKDAENIGDLVRKGLQSVLQNKYEHIIGEIEGGIPCVISSTQSSVAKQRHFSLSQENGISSAGDIMMVSYFYPIKRTLKHESKSYQEDLAQREFQQLIQILNKQLCNEKLSNISIDCDISNILIASGVLLHRERKLHAEMDCTQRIYHYILPLSWLEGGNEIASWWMDNQKLVCNTFNETKTSFKSRGEARARDPPPNDILIRFKSALRSFESEKVENWDDECAAVGRYGALALRKRTAFHNFADPNLMGDASPSNKPVWRVIDRCRIAEFISFLNKNGHAEVSLVVEIRADDLLVDQVRRIIGTSIAVANRWLPSDFTTTATDPTLFVQTPLSPVNRCYFAHSRFHFDELLTGTSLFQDDHRNECISKIQKRIVSRANEDDVGNYEDSFLHELKCQVCPRIHEELERTKTIKHTDFDFRRNTNTERFSKPPTIYKESLSSLRDIVESGKWLATSAARSKVIKKAEEERDPGKITSGSFTIINPTFENGSLLTEEKIRLPLGNQVFPELVRAIFDLESNISRELGLDRPSSSHCAVNRNAQFTPHVDSGRGLGQSRSMIVGLGDYTGGEIFVEGKPSVIRYEPLEFDGWKQRHWTAPFEGERYSLVWFTPEI